MLPSEANTQQHEDLVVNSIRNLMAGIPIDPEVFANEPTSADAEALRLLDSNTGRFAKNYIAKQKNPDPRIVKAMTGGDGFSQEKFRSAVESVEEPTPEEAEQRREGLLEASTFLPGVGGGIDVAKTALDKESTLADFGIAAASFLPGGKLATTALKKADKLVPIFPKPERMAGIKGGQYLDTTTNKDITGRNITNASISVSPEGRPSFLGNIKEVENVGSVGKGKTQIKTNLFKKKAGWKWTKPVKGYEEAPTLISVQQKGKHYYTLNTDFPRGVNLKRYENLPSEPRLRPTLTGELQLGKEIGEISVRGKAHPVYDTIQAKEKGGMIDMRQMQEGGMLGGDLPPEAIADGAVMNGAPVGEVNVPGGGGPTDDGVPTELPEGTFVLNAAAVEYHGTKHINDLIKGSIRNLVKKGVQITGEDLNPDDDVPVAISNGEYIIPPEVARDVGIKKLEDMNERGLEYRKKVEETEKQKAAEQEQAMQSFMGQPMPEEAAQAPIQSETQMPLEEGGEAEPPDAPEPEAPELSETERKILEFEKMKQEYFEKKEREERQKRLLERAGEQIQKDIEMGVTRDNPSLGGYGHPGGGGSTILRMDIAEGGRVPMKDGGFFTNLAQGFMNLFTEDPKDFAPAPEAVESLLPTEEQILQQQQPPTPEPIPGGGSIYDEIQRRREQGMADSPEQQQMAQSDSFVPMYPAIPKEGIPDPHTGKTTRPVPWLPKTAQSGGTIERDPQSSFLLPEAARQVQGLPVGANTYPTSPQESFVGSNITGSVLANLSNAAPTPIAMQPQQGFVQPFTQKKSFEPDRLSFDGGGDVTNEERDKVAAYELTGGDVKAWNEIKSGNRKTDLFVNKQKVYDGATQQLVVYRDHNGNRTILGVNLDADIDNKDIQNLEVGKTWNTQDVLAEQNKIYDQKIRQEAEFSRTHGITDPQARRVTRDLFFNFGQKGFATKMPGAFAALKEKDWGRFAQELKWYNPNKKESPTSYFKPDKSINVRAQDNINTVLDLVKQQQLAQGFMPDIERSFLTT